MLRFFRQFRYRLMNNNPSKQTSRPGRYSKYLFYVIGEIVILIIGIFLALQVDTWNNQRQDREEAGVFLERLKNEFLDNRKQLVQKITMRKLALESARELLRYVDGDSGPYSRFQVDSMLANALPVYTFDPSQGVLNQLTSTDKLTLMRSEALNDSLSNWNSTIQDFKEDENMYNSYNHNHFRPFLYSNYNYRNIISARIANKVIDPILLAPSDRVNTPIGLSGSPVTLDLLTGDKEFENHLASVISWLSLINTQSEGVLGYIDSILEIIDQELNTE
jgi:hypothetical protein